MNEIVENFIKDWNLNTHKLEIDSLFSRKKPQDLMDFCIEIHKEISVYNLLKDIYKKESLYTSKINSYSKFKIALEKEFHKQNVSDTFSDRKYRYRGEKVGLYEIILERKVISKTGTPIIPKIDEDFIDRKIIESYFSRKKEFESSAYSFIFFQASLYNFNIKKIETWKKFYELEYGENDLFINQVIDFFKIFFLKKNETDKIQLWITFYIKNSNFRFFEEYSGIEVKKDYEKFINLFRKLHYKNLFKRYTSRAKKSINEKKYLNTEIKRLKNIITVKSSYDSFPIIGEYKETLYSTYNRLVQGNREYFNDFVKTDRAGEVEAINDFIKYLEDLNLNKEKQEVIENYDNAEILLPEEIFNNTKGYLIKNAKQVNICYKHKAYDACSVLLRKITEILIIELFEKEEIESKIKDADGNYFTLKGLIKSVINEVKFKNTFSRNVSEILPKIKRLGDLSAHNRKYNSKKLDIDRISDDFRLLFEEFVNSIY